MAEFVKRNPDAPTGFFDCEATGLRWLSAVDGGARCAQVLAWDDTSPDPASAGSSPATVQAAFDFGRRLAITMTPAPRVSGRPGRLDRAGILRSPAPPAADEPGRVRQLGPFTPPSDWP